MKFKADLAYQNRYTVVKDCEIEKTIRLSREEFNAFSDDLLSARDFIRENKERMFRGDDNTFHCLLVTGEGHDDGVLVYSEGYDFASYACHVPDAKALLTVSQSPALTGLCEKLSGLADYLAESYLTLLDVSDSAALFLNGQARDFKQIKNMVIQEAMRMGSQQTQQPAREAPVVAVSAAARLLRELSKLFDDQQQKQIASADHIDRKRARELREKRQAQGHARDEQVQSY